MSFKSLQLCEPLLRAVSQAGYATPTPIQRQAIPAALSRRDILGIAQTGTGKTAAFALPILHRLHTEPGRKPGIRALVLTPTRELAGQIDENFRLYGRYTNLRPNVVYGGVSQTPQVKQLQNGTDILTATPGRLLDLLGQGLVRLNTVEILVLDEADRMLDMGFIHDIRRILGHLSGSRQTLFFSATMPENIRRLADDILSDPLRVSIAPESPTLETIEQKVFLVAKSDKKSLLIHLLEDPQMDSVLVFSRTKHGADRLARVLSRQGIRCDAIHGDKGQNARQRALDHFKNHVSRVLVATDIAARGIDVDGLSYVVNYDLPADAESYVHRIGRTGRAGREGVSLSFCDQSELDYLRAIEKMTGRQLEVVEQQPFHQLEYAAVLEAAAAPPAQKDVQKKPADKRPGGRRRFFRTRTR